MTLVVQREWLTPKSTVGVLTVDGQNECFTLEPPQRELKPRAIPAGTYELTLRLSPSFQRLMPHVENVPGFQGILIHWGNKPADTEGCCLVGESRAADWVSTSREAFDRLFLLLSSAHDNCEPMTITYLDPAPIPILDPEISA